MGNARRSATISLLIGIAVGLVAVFRSVEASFDAHNEKLIEGAEITYFGGDAMQQNPVTKLYSRCDLDDNQSIELGKQKIINDDSFFRAKHFKYYGTCIKGYPIFIGEASLVFNGFKVNK